VIKRQNRSDKDSGAIPDVQVTGESVVLIGSVPCKLASEVHENGQRIGGAKTMHAHEGEMVVHGDHGACSGPMAKRACVITAEGCEVVSLGYSVCGQQAGPKWDGR
jgi:hypothetical protein